MPNSRISNHECKSKSEGVRCAHDGEEKKKKNQVLAVAAKRSGLTSGWVAVTASHGPRLCGGCFDSVGPPLSGFRSEFWEGPFPLPPPVYLAGVYTRGTIITAIRAVCIPRHYNIQWGNLELELERGWSTGGRSGAEPPPISGDTLHP